MFGQAPYQEFLYFMQYSTDVLVGRTICTVGAFCHIEPVVNVDEFILSPTESDKIKSASTVLVKAVDEVFGGIKAPNQPVSVAVAAPLYIKGTLLLVPL